MESWIVDVDQTTFEREVIEQSRTVPVLVDFWAEWCGPCRTLGPLLEAAIEARGGAVRLAKLNTDQNQQLAGSFGIRGIPTVKAFVDGRVADEFVGVRDRRGIDAFIDGVCPSDEDRALQQATQKVAAGDFAGAATLASPLVASAKHREAALLVLGEAQAAMGQVEEARATLDQITAEGPYAAQADALHVRIELRQAAGRDEPSLREALAKDPEDLDARWALIATLIEGGQVAPALDELLELLQRGRKYREDGARRAMLAIFTMLGVDDPLVHEYRRRMQIYL